ncbi:MAG: transglutaminaseTgpA domain-containing protein [Gammaproteobacteria bacterium]
MKPNTKQQTKWQHGVAAQIPRNSLLMLMAAFTIVIIPHIAQVSPWIIGAGLFCLWWRWRIFIGRSNFLSIWQKALLVIICGTAVVLSEGVTQNLETWAALLIMAFSLKLLETKTQRDAYVVVFIAYFVIAIEFIFNHSIGIVAYELCALILVTAATIGMNLFHTRVEIFKSIKVASKILAQAIPLMIVLFVLFPRIGPIWAISSPNQQARSGLSSEMTPGDIAKLSLSDEIAFRAIFKDTPPATSDLYWRGRVYTNFKNGTWSETDIPVKFSNINKIDWASTPETAWFIPKINKTSEESISYTILLEPTHNQWLVGMDLAIPQTRTAGTTWDYKLINRQPVQSLLKYEVLTYPNATLNTWLPEFLRNLTTQIDKDDNPQTILFAKSLYADSTNTEDFVEKILEQIRNLPFHYTLEPPKLEKEGSIDQFWFETRQGFCTHYAGATVYMLRAAGIPARMVGGYQGGEINPITGHVVVRQYLAHAWVEYWTPKKGWQRVDPTAAVAPSRIHDGLSAALPENELNSLSIFSNARINRMPGLQKIMFLFESIEHRWNLFIIGYNSELQTNLLEKLLGKITAFKIAMVLLVGAFLSTFFVAASLFMSGRDKKRHPVVKAFQNFSTRMAKQGIKRKPHESPALFIKNICQQRKLDQQAYQPIVNMLNDLLYNPNASYTQETLNTLKNNFQALHLKLS